MAMSFSEFVKKVGAEVSGGRVIVGERNERRFLGDLKGGIFQLNTEGQEVMEKLEAGEAAEAALEAARKAELAREESKKRGAPLATAQ